MNAELTKKAITKRFLQIIDELIQDGVCDTKKEFAERIGEHPQNLTLMAKGTRAPTLEQVAQTCKLFGYSPTWLILNEGPRKLVDLLRDEGLNNRVDDLETEVENLKKFLLKKIATGG
jgi:hypothetical protein